MEIRDPCTNRITGVYSGSDKAPLRRKCLPTAVR